MMIREPDPPPGSAPERTDAEAIRTAVAELARKIGPAAPGGAAPAPTVRRVSIRRPEGEAAAADEEDIFAAPGAAAEAPARVTTRSTPTPVRAAAGFRPSRWIPGVGVVLLLIAGAAWWSGFVPRQRGTEVGIPAAAPAAPPSQPSAPSTTTAAAPGATASPPSAKAPQVATATAPFGASAPPAPSPPAPSFDIVRVTPDGRAVIAGRAAPGSRVTVLDGERELATVQADPRGEWVAVLDQPLAPGGHELRLVQQADGQPAARSDRTVAVAVPPAMSTSSGKPDAAAASTAPTAPLVVSTPTARGPSTVLQAPGGTDTLARSGTLVLGAVDYDDQGYMALSGTAPAGTTVRVYVDNQVVGEATAGADRRWTMLPTDTIPLGKRTVRVDQVDGSGSVTARVEVPFERMAMAKPGAVTIVRGDNLWTIARNRYGDGGRYTVIYEANKGQIRDPNLIYPGQIFVVPKTP